MLGDIPGLGHKGDITGIEVNMRPPGGNTPDMLNFANGLDVYQNWANMLTCNKGFCNKDSGPYCCVYAARRDGSRYVHSTDTVLNRYECNSVMVERVLEVLSGAMGNGLLTARFPVQVQAMELIDFYLKKM